jgi:Holliday junction resolvasome RuvABC endonuclease subunit
MGHDPEVPVNGASLASRRFARTITQREDVAVSGQSAMAATGLILLSAHRHGSPRHPHLPQSVSVGLFGTARTVRHQVAPKWVKHVP